MANEKQVCDIVMKGGITSGVVYPGVIDVLKDSYTFKSIGGTSAGAIAAATLAAAERARTFTAVRRAPLRNSIR